MLHSVVQVSTTTSLLRRRYIIMSTRANARTRLSSIQDRAPRHSTCLAWFLMCRNNAVVEACPILPFGSALVLVTTMLSPPRCLDDRHPLPQPLVVVFLVVVHLRAASTTRRRRLGSTIMANETPSGVSSSKMNCT